MMGQMLSDSSADSLCNYLNSTFAVVATPMVWLDILGQEEKDTMQPTCSNRLAGFFLNPGRTLWIYIHPVVSLRIILLELLSSL